VYDVIGQKVATLVAEHQQPGYKSIVWNSQNENGESLGSGMYFYRMVAGDFIQSRKLVLIK
ncbi:MAG: hypothetical protein FJ218_11290, partial [Ignavibacteria bacterium]|nr:hypothetical protein [Ignavibacteria bacterium]